MPTDNRALNFAAIAPLLTEKWAMSRERVLATLAMIAAGPEAQGKDAQATDPKVACGGYFDDSEEDAGYTLKDGVATISIVGVLVKYPTWWSSRASSIEIQKTLQRAIADFQVRSIALVIDSPGGMVAGVNELMEYITQVNGTGPGQKPIHAVVSDLAASAGYMIASACTSISCNTWGESGCIGVYCVLTDETKYWEEIGISFEVISSGGVKGLGADGKVTPELRADVQRGIDDAYNLFLEAVMRGRKIDLQQAKKLGDGRSWVAAQAKQLGLIDTVASVGDSIVAITQRTQTMTAEQVKAYLAEHPDDPAVASIRDTARKAGEETGKAEGRKAGLATAAAINVAFGLADHAATASIKAGDDETTAKRIADAQAAAKAEAAKAAAAETERSAALVKENERLKAELGTQGGLNLGGNSKQEHDKQAGGGAPAGGDAGDPEALAKAEWAKLTADQKSGWKDEKTFVATRKRQIERGE